MTEENKPYQQDDTDSNRGNNFSHNRYFNKRSITFFVIFLFLFILLSVHFFSAYIHRLENTPRPERVEQISNKIKKEVIRPTSAPIPEQKTLSNSYHVFQSFNNCGPAAFSMALSYYGINVSQAELGQALRPYQNPHGDNDDKSVTLEEIADYAQANFGLIAYRRPMGNEEIVRQFIANDIPVITRTWLKKEEDIGHYRIIKGYDNIRGVFIQDDSLQGKDLTYSYQEFNEIWKKFNYEYLVLVPEDKKMLAEKILGDDLDEKVAWQKAVENSKNDLASNPSDFYAGFNLSVAYFEIGNYQKSIEEYEKVANRLPFRTLWYQIEPVKAYFEVGDYEEVLALSERVLNNHNRAYSELYILRGDTYRAQNNITLARQEYEKAVLYNTNLEIARDRLASL